MLGWMDAEALRRTLTEGRVTFWSRSRQEYWRKGDTSGHIQYVRGARPSTATATPCSCRSSRSVPPATPARAPASTCDPLQPVTGRRETPNDDGDRCDRPRTARVRRPAAAITGSSRSSASSSPTARRRSASTASSRRARPGTFLLESAEQGGIWSRYSFVGVSSFGVLTQHGDAVEWLDYGLSAERALGDDRPTGAARRPRRTSIERWQTPRHRRAPAADRRTRRIHRLGGDPADRAPAGPAAGRLRRCPGQAFSFVAELVVVDHRTGTVQLIATALNDGRRIAPRRSGPTRSSGSTRCRSGWRRRPRPGSPRST